MPSERTFYSVGLTDTVRIEYTDHTIATDGQWEVAAAASVRNATASARCVPMKAIEALNTLGQYSGKEWKVLLLETETVEDGDTIIRASDGASFRVRGQPQTGALINAGLPYGRSVIVVREDI